MDLKDKFTSDVLARFEKAKAIGAYPARLAQTVSTKGGVDAARFIVSKGGISENFEKLAKLGKLELSLEAAVTDSKYGALFTDEEVNHCFASLCDFGYFKI